MAQASTAPPCRASTCARRLLAARGHGHLFGLAPLDHCGPDPRHDAIARHPGHTCCPFRHRQYGYQSVWGVPPLQQVVPVQFGTTLAVDGLPCPPGVHMQRSPSFQQTVSTRNTDRCHRARPLLISATGLARQRGRIARRPGRRRRDLAGAPIHSGLACRFGRRGRGAAGRPLLAHAHTIAAALGPAPARAVLLAVHVILARDLAGAGTAWTTGRCTTSPVRSPPSNPPSTGRRGDCRSFLRFQRSSHPTRNPPG